MSEERPLPRRIGRYRVICELGSGGMAIVYLGRAGGPGGFERLFAIKIIHEHLCREQRFVDLFLNEARIAARIHHPNVIPVYDIERDKGRYFLSMDYVSGETLIWALKETWDEGRPFPLDIAAHLIASACEGLHAAHSLTDPDGKPLEIIHRDVSPQNIMIGYDGIVRVMDFGIAKAFEQVTGTRPGTLRGSIPYMAPEQARGEKVDRRADIFALGVVLWETTVGKRLFKHRTDVGTAARVLAMEVPRPSSLRSGYPAKLETIILRALERDPGRRFQTARELGEALQDFLASEGVHPTSGRIEAFMKDVCHTRHLERREMERQASVPEPRSVSTPRGDAPTEILSLIDLRDNEPIANPEVFKALLSEPSASATPLASALASDPDPTREVRVPGDALQTERSEVPATTGRRRLVVGVGALVVAILGVAYAISSDTTPQSTPEPEPQARAHTEPTDSGARGAPARLSETITIRVRPRKAAIHVRGVRHVGQATLPRSDTPQLVKTMAPGYQSKSLLVPEDAPALLKVVLEPLPRTKRATRRRPPKPPKRRKAAQPSKKPKPKLFGGDEL